MQNSTANPPSILILLLALLFGSTLFGSTLMAQQATPLHLTLDQYIDKCKNNSLIIKKQTIQDEMAMAEYTQAKQWWLPDLFAGTRFHHLDGSAMNGDGGIFRDVDRQNRWYGGEIDLNWNIVEGMGNVKAKKMAAEATQINNTVALNQSVVDAINTYYQLLVAEMENNIYADLINDKRALIEQLTIQVDAGLRLESELLLAKSNVQRLKLQALSAQQGYTQAAARMAQTLNLRKLTPISTDTMALKMIDLVNLSDKIDMSNNPIIKAQEQSLAAQKKATKMVIKGFHYPELGLKYSYGPFGDAYDNTNGTRALQGYVGWNIPLGQLIYGGNDKVAKAKESIALIETEEKTIMLTQEVEQYKTQLQSIKTLIGGTTEGGAYAKEALRQATYRQQNGLGSSYEVLQAQEEYIQNKLLYTRMIAAHNVMQYRLYVLMGGSL